MFSIKIHAMSKNLQILRTSKLNYSTLLFLMTLSFSVYAQDVDDELPEIFFGNWVEDVSQCDAGSYFSVANSEVGLLVFGLGWSSNEVKVKNMGSYYRLFVYGVSEGGDFESEIKIRMGDDGNLFFIDSDSEEIELVKCDPIEFEEFEALDTLEMTLGDEGLEEMVLDMSDMVDVGSIDTELPLEFYGNWVEELSQCEGVPPFSLNYSEGGLLVSGLDWYSTEVKVTSKEGYYTLTIKGLSEEGEFDTEIIILLDEDENLFVNLDGGETGSKLVKCNPIFDEYDGVDMGLEVSDLQEVEDDDLANSVGLESINIELLQGKWQSIEDESSFMIIEGDRMKNYYGGMDDELDNEMIMISDTCMNESDSENDLPEEKNRYLSNPNLDMCWFIESVDATNLTLIYMASGNTLTYKRVE